MATNDSFGDRMKMYEGIEAGRRFMPLLPIVARIDGRAFSKFTRGFAKPFDQRMSDAMIATTKHLVKHTNALMGYTQSDEISLVWLSNDIKELVWFDGRISKMISQLSAQATLMFYREVVDRMPEYADRLPTFDARCWQVPNKEEAVNALLWREQDATRNSIQMAGHTYFSAKQLHKKSTSDIQDMLHAEHGINWNNYPAFFKRGVFIQRSTVTGPLSLQELENLPPRHHARTNPDLQKERKVISTIEMPPFGKVLNRVEVVFEGAYPETSGVAMMRHQEEMRREGKLPKSVRKPEV